MIQRSSRYLYFGKFLSTNSLTYLVMISKTTKPIMMEIIHSRLLNVFLSTKVFFAVRPHRLRMLLVSKNWETRRVAAIAIKKPMKLPVSLSYRYWRIFFLLRCFIWKKTATWLVNRNFRVYLILKRRGRYFLKLNPMWSPNPIPIPRLVRVFEEVFDLEETAFDFVWANPAFVTIIKTKINNLSFIGYMDLVFKMPKMLY